MAEQHTWEGMTDREILLSLLSSIYVSARSRGTVPTWLDDVAAEIYVSDGMNHAETILYAWKNRKGD